MAAKPSITTITGQAANNAFQVNTALDELATAQTNLLERDGTDSMDGNLNMDGNIITNHGQGSAPTDVATIGDVTATVLFPGSVVYSYIQDIAANNVFLGNDDGAGSTVQEITATQARGILNVEDGSTADQSNAEIKVAYEANADTEAYTTAEQTKVGYVSVTGAINLDTVKTKTDFISVTQAVNLDTMESNIATNNAKITYPSVDSTKVGYISVTGAINLDPIKTKTDFISVTQAVNLDTMESNIATNNAKVTNATHTGDVTGTTALTIAGGAVDIAMLSATGTPDNTSYLRGDNQWVTGTVANIDDTAYVRSVWNGDTANAPTKNACSDTFYNMVRYLDADTGAVGNTFVGQTGNTTNTGSYNNFIGLNAGYSNTTGVNNNFIGLNTGYSNTTGLYNNFIGVNTGYSNTTGSYNNFIGVDAGYNNTTGSYNCGFGTNALYAANNVLSVKNCAFGNYALDAVTSGHDNSCYGYGSGGSITTGAGNCVFGGGVSGAGESITTGDYNVVIGYDVPGSITTSSSRLYIGNSASASITGLFGSYIDINEHFRFGGGIGSSVSLDTNGQISLQSPNNSTVRVLLRGSDGTTRTVDLTVT